MASNKVLNLKYLTRHVDMSNKNETINEVAIKYLKYLLLLAFLGTFIIKKYDSDDRMHFIKIRQIKDLFLIFY